MSRQKRVHVRFATIGLVLAGFGCVATGVLGLVQGTVALKLFTPADPAALRQWIGISAGVLLLGLALYGILDPSGTRRYLTGRQARYGSNALIMSLAFIGILVVVNLLVYQNQITWDFTEGKQHTLAPETIQALATVPEKITAIAFFSKQYPSETAKQLLTDLKTSGKGRFDYRFVDPNEDPILARQYAITGDGKIVLTMGKLAETAAYADENSLTQAMIKLISPQVRVVYFLTGHGEHDLEGSNTTSLSRAREVLQSKNYTIKSLNIATTSEVPEDAKTIIVAGREHAFLDQEILKLKRYMDKGGSLIVLEDPTPFTQIGGGPDALADYLRADWAIALENDVVIDLTSNQPFHAISSSWSSSAPITQYLNAFTIMPQSRSLRIETTLPENVTVTPLILTSGQSWGETDLDSLDSTQQIAFDPAVDIAGPLTLAASAENTVKKGRVVVFGNSIFATNEGFEAYANGDVFTNSVDWAAQEGDLINITPRTPIARTFNPPGQLVFITIILGSVILIPGLVLIAGISTWLARRKAG